MNKYQKYVNALFLAAGALVWFVSKHYIVVTIGYFQLGRTLGVGAEVIEHALPILLGVVTFVLLRRSATSFNFATDAVGELTKVSWPTQKEVQLGTIVVIMTVILAGVLLGLLDMGLVAIVRGLIGA